MERTEWKGWREEKKQSSPLQKGVPCSPCCQIPGRSIPNAKSAKEGAARDWDGGKETFWCIGVRANRPGLTALGTVGHPGQVSAVLTTHPPFKTRPGCGLTRTL